MPAAKMTTRPFSRCRTARRRMYGSAIWFMKTARHHAALHAALLQRVLQGNGVDHRRQHAHVVGGHAVHFFRLLGHSAEEIAAADYDADFHAQPVDIGDFVGDFSDLVGVQAELVLPRQCFS